MSRLAIVMLVAAASLCAAVSASARTVFDGRWSVLIITERGPCDRGYRYAIDIRDGIIYYDGDVVDIRGRVARNGAVRVVVSRGNLSASGTGRLGRDYGEGTWRGPGSDDACSGRWEVERR
jgi:hypothetical protein